MACVPRRPTVQVWHVLRENGLSDGAAVGGGALYNNVRFGGLSVIVCVFVLFVVRRWVSFLLLIYAGFIGEKNIGRKKRKCLHNSGLIANFASILWRIGASCIANCVTVTAIRGV